MKLIIKGLIYFDGNNILRPHFTGNFHTVDCTEYKTKKEIKETYNKDRAKTFIKNGQYIIYNDIKYYECEYSPINTEGMELLSSIDKIEYYDDMTDFKD